MSKTKPGKAGRASSATSKSSKASAASAKGNGATRPRASRPTVAVSRDRPHRRRDGASKGGRPSKLTPAVHEKIVTAIRAGNYAQVAAVYAGIGERTFYRWMELGERAKAGRYRQFWQAVKAAEGEAEVRAVAIIQKQMPANWRAAMTYLERKHPKRWGRRMDVTSGDEPIVPVKIETAEEAREALRALGVRTD